MSYKLSGFYDDFHVLAQKFLDTKTEVMESLVDVKYSSNFEAEELRSQIRELETKINLLASLDENNKSTLTEFLSEIQTIKLEIGKVNTMMNNTSLNNLLKPEFDCRIQQFNLDMNIIDSKISKLSSEMNLLNNLQAKSLSNAIELINVGLTYISHPLASTKEALMSLFASVSFKS